MNSLRSLSNRRKIVIIILILVMVLPGTFFLLVFKPGEHSGERDISWIDTVNDFIEEVKPSEPIETWITITGYRFSLHENGTQQILYHVYNEFKSKDDFVSYMRNLLYKVNNIINSSINGELFSEILEKNKVLQVDFGTDTGETFWKTNAYTVAWFILEDNINKDLEGTIIIKQQIFPTWKIEETLREIRK